MRNGGEDDDELMFPAPPSPPIETALPTPPAPSVAKSSIVGMMPMQPMPANVMSPDDMLRAYAERRNMRSPPTVGAPAFPMPVANFNNHGMRTLYSPTTPEAGVVSMPVPVFNAPVPPAIESLYPDMPDNFVGGFRSSMVPTFDSQYADENYEGETGTAE